MSDSPPKEADVEQNAQSGEEQDHMDREQEGAQAGEFEVKEQDRWLPIANGWCSSPFIFCFFVMFTCSQSFSHLRFTI
jgi:nuclear transcription Y subunit beta